MLYREEKAGHVHSALGRDAISGPPARRFGSKGPLCAGSFANGACASADRNHRMSPRLSDIYSHHGSARRSEDVKLTAPWMTARSRNPRLDASCLDFVRDVLLLNDAGHLFAEQREARLAFVMRWQQFTGPIVAKGLEDTVLYVYCPLLSLNEVGGNPSPSAGRRIRRSSNSRRNATPLAIWLEFHFDARHQTWRRRARTNQRSLRNSPRMAKHLNQMGAMECEMEENNRRVPGSS